MKLNLRGLAALAFLLGIASAAPALQAPVRNRAKAQPPQMGSAFQDFALKIQSTVQAGDASLLNGQGVDFDALVSIAMKGVDAPADLINRFVEIGRSQLQLGSNLVEAIKGGGSYRFLRIRPGPDGQPKALFRLILTSGAVNYHEYALRRDASGTVRVMDVYIFTTGEWISQTLRRGWVALMATTGYEAQLKRLAGFESDLTKNLPEIEKINRLQGEGQYQAALNTLLVLPASLQRDKNMLIQRMGIAQRIGEREYSEAIDAFARQFPNDAAMDLLLIDAYVKSKQYDLALASIERLRQNVGGDAHLDFLTGNINYAKKDFASAKTALRKALYQEPTLVAPHWTLLGIAIEEKNHMETAFILTTLEKDFAVEIGDLKAVPMYADFVRSSVYDIWLASRRRTGPPIPPVPPAPSEPYRVGGQIKEPKRLVDVRPVYPDIARQARVQGVVIIECTISPEGRITDMKILRGIPLLDAAALDAVRQWVYEPTYVNDIPVPLIMTVTVSFTLS